MYIQQLVYVMMKIMELFSCLCLHVLSYQIAALVLYTVSLPISYIDILALLVGIAFQYFQHDIYQLLYIQGSTS